MMLPSVDNVSVLSPVHRIVKNVLLRLPQRRAPFPMPGSWAAGTHSTGVSIHEFVTLPALFTVRLDIT